MTSAEWTYLLTTRKVGDEDSAFSFVRIKYGDHETDTVTGILIYPDDFSFSEVGVASMTFGARGVVEIEKATWEALESAGCVFIPGNRHRTFSTEGGPGISEEYFGQNAFVWSANGRNARHSEYAFFNINSGTFNPESSNNRYHGLPVRLAQDVK